MASDRDGTSAQDGGAASPNHWTAMRDLRTVSVPAPLSEIFLRAQSYVARYFSDRVEDPGQGSITIAGERYILVRAASMSVEFFELVASLYREKGGEAAHLVAKNLLFDVAHAIGKADARVFHERMGVTDPVERLSAGPVHFAFAGWASVLIHPESRPDPSEDYYLLYDHPYSFEADAWLKRASLVSFPVCVMNCGYSSGWCEDSFGLSLVAAEVECRAMGDDHCRFVMAPPSRIEQRVTEYRAGARSDRKRSPWRGTRAVIDVPEFFQRKRMEDALKASYEDLERRVEERTAEIVRANAALKEEMAKRQREAEERRLLEAQLLETQKLESLGVLAGGIAHDFNNLLVGVLGNAGLALEELPSDSPARDYVKDIEIGAWRAADLVRQMLAYAGKGRLVIERVDLSRLVREMLHLLMASINKKAVLDFVPTEPGPSVEGDATQLRQVVMNLIINASDALGDASGTIVVRTGVLDRPPEGEGAYFGATTPAGACAFLLVSDSGGGMDSATRDRMFEPFFTTKFTGRGLGLAAVQGIVRSHGGAIKVTSAPGKGTTVHVLLPLAPSVAAPDMDRARSTARGPRSEGIVLLADDEPLVRNVAQRVLESMGLTVLLAADGAEAVAVFERHHADIDLAVLDLTMPRMDGVEAFRAMQQIAPGVRAVLTSGFTGEEADSDSWRTGFLGFLRKPYAPRELADRVRDLLAKPPSP